MFSYVAALLLRRDGLSARAYGQSDQAQISIELGEGFDLDNEIDGLRSQVGRLKEVRLAYVKQTILIFISLLACLNAQSPSLCSDAGHSQMSRAIGEENRLQRQQAESLEELMERAKTDLKRGMRRLNRAFQQSRSNHLLYLVIFCIVIFFGLYMWAKMYRMVRWLS